MAIIATDVLSSTVIESGNCNKQMVWSGNYFAERGRLFLDLFNVALSIS